MWSGLLAGLYQHLLASTPEPGPSGAIHAVLMASQSDDPHSTTGLYNHFAGRFFGHHNDQDLRARATELAADSRFASESYPTGGASGSAAARKLRPEPNLSPERSHFPFPTFSSSQLERISVW